jgi:hypothetical protein
MGTLRAIPTTTHSPARKSPHPPAIRAARPGRALVVVNGRTANRGHSVVVVADLPA